MASEKFQIPNLGVKIPLCPVSICFEMDSDVAGLSIVRSRFLE